MEGCPFCIKLDALSEVASAEVVWRFRHSVAFLGRWQYFTGYCVLVSRTHASEITHLPANERRGFFDEMCVLAGAIEAEFRPKKLNYELLGNQVPHLHWHIFPRTAGDLDPLRPVWFALEKAEQDVTERERLEQLSISHAEIAQRLRQRLARLTDEQS